MNVIQIDASSAQSRIKTVIQYAETVNGIDYISGHIVFKFSARRAGNEVFISDVKVLHHSGLIRESATTTNITFSDILITISTSGSTVTVALIHYLDVGLAGNKFTIPFKLNSFKMSYADMLLT